MSDEKTLHRPFSNGWLFGWKRFFATAFFAILHACLLSLGLIPPETWATGELALMGLYFGSSVGIRWLQARNGGGSSGLTV